MIAREREHQRERAETIGREAFPNADRIVAHLHADSLYIEVWKDRAARLFLVRDEALSAEAHADARDATAEAAVAEKRSAAARKAVATRRRRQARRQ